ncbi:MAG: hypothetical protein HC927_09880, partial [Deltaproteobacteria bacterium]|nr:hypothetical protein [Deltaproteobacteria bacterium]
MSNKLSQGSTPDNVLPPSWTRFGSLGLLVVATLGASGCIEDSDCGICDPDKLVLESISGINYSDRSIHLLTPGVKEGKYFIEDIGACVETPEANNEIPTQNAERGPEEWCKLSPLVSWRGLEFVFNNLLEPTSIELIRKQPTNPNLFEVYDWKSKIAHIEGPITRYNGDYRATPGDDPDTVSRGINLTCIDNLAALGQSFNHEVLDQNPGICEGFYEADGRTLPLKMQYEGKTESYRGETDWRVYSCAAPDSGPDTCCSVCDYELSVNVAKYGLETEGGARRSPANALTCDPNGNVYEDCAGFVPFVDREFETNRYVYDWNGSVGEWRVAWPTRSAR